MDSMMNKAKTLVAEKVVRIKKPEADLTDVDIMHIGRDAATFDGKVSVDNPYDHDLPICEISYTLKSANRVLVSGVVPDPGSLEGMKKTVLDVPMKVPYDVLVSLAKDIGADWDIDYDLLVGLTFDLPIIGNLTLPLNKKGQLRLPTLSSIFA